MDCRVKPGNDGKDCGATVLHLLDRDPHRMRRHSELKVGL